jgi:hypothetical protein
MTRGGSVGSRSDDGPEAQAAAVKRGGGGGLRRMMPLTRESFLVWQTTMTVLSMMEEESEQPLSDDSHPPVIRTAWQRTRDAMMAWAEIKLNYAFLHGYFEN